jgi:hypothetical protein
MTTEDISHFTVVFFVVTCLIFGTWWGYYAIKHRSLELELQEYHLQYHREHKAFNIPCSYCGKTVISQSKVQVTMEEADCND